MPAGRSTSDRRPAPTGGRRSGSPTGACAVRARSPRSREVRRAATPYHRDDRRLDCNHAGPARPGRGGNEAKCAGGHALLRRCLSIQGLAGCKRRLTARDRLRQDDKTSASARRPKDNTRIAFWADNATPPAMGVLRPIVDRPAMLRRLDVEFGRHSALLAFAAWQEALSNLLTIRSVMGRSSCECGETPTCQS